MDYKIIDEEENKKIERLEKEYKEEKTSSNEKDKNEKNKNIIIASIILGIGILIPLIALFPSLPFLATYVVPAFIGVFFVALIPHKTNMRIKPYRRSYLLHKEKEKRESDRLFKIEELEKKLKNR